MHNTRKAILRKQGLSKKQIRILAELEEKMITLIGKRRSIERKYSSVLEKYQKLVHELGVK